MKSLDDWYLQQHPEDQHGVDPLMDKMNEELHRVDREQERMAARMRQNAPSGGTAAAGLRFAERRSRRLTTHDLFTLFRITKKNYEYTNSCKMRVLRRGLP